MARGEDESKSSLRHASRRQAGDETVEVSQSPSEEALSIIAWAIRSAPEKFPRPIARRHRTRLS
jgi:hypothetical protein